MIKSYSQASGGLSGGRERKRKSDEALTLERGSGQGWNVQDH